MAISPVYKRKIQLVAGTTYSLSLPKDWVRKNNLKEKNQVEVYEKADRSLIISPNTIEEKALKEISLNIDEYVQNIDQVMFAVYYLGVETITVFSKSEITKDAKTKVRRTLSHMSGAEIAFEDKKKIQIRVLIDKSKVDIKQILYRIVLIIDLSITNILEHFDIEEIRMNEYEIDRLYHLIAKIISTSLIDSKVLLSSNIKNASLIPSYFLMSKKLENIADNIMYLSEYLHTSKSTFKHRKEIFDFIHNALLKQSNYLNGKQKGMFKKIEEDSRLNTIGLISSVKDVKISTYLNEILVFITDIDQEIVNISFYQKLITEGVL